MVARRREVGGHRFAAAVVKGGLRSKLGAAAAGAGRKGCWGPVERAESPARPSIVPLFLWSLRPLLAVVGRGADAGAVPASLQAGCAPPDPELSGARVAQPTPQPPPEGGSGLLSVFAALSPHPRRLPERRALPCNFSLPIDGSCGFWAAGSLGISWFLASWRSGFLGLNDS